MKLLTPIVHFVRDPKQLLHFIVLVACMCISVYQLYGCIIKLRHPPVSTHYLFVINETLTYPAVTICRNPSYKTKVLQDFNLAKDNSNILFTSEWANFPFKNATLQDLWDKATYSQSEVLQLYGLHGYAENVEVRRSYYLMYGQCFTLIPRVGSTMPWPNSGWSIMLQHDKGDHSGSGRRLGLATDSDVDGFHIFIHEVREPWSENDVQTHYIMQYLYIEVGEELEIKINAEEYNGISTENRPCLTDINYSRYKVLATEWLLFTLTNVQFEYLFTEVEANDRINFQCIESHRWTNISKKVGCTAPWMRGVGLPHCNNYHQLKYLITNYLKFDDKNEWGCSMSCNATAYKLFVVKRAPMEMPFSHLYIYFSSKMVSKMEELPGYDFNAFLSDLGGSLGFFLGLSVIGTIGIIEKFFRIIFCYAKPALPALTENKKPIDAVDKY